MAIYQDINVFPPSGPGYQPGDIVECPAGSAVRRWQYLGRDQWAPADMATIRPMTAAQFATYTGQSGEFVEVTDEAGRPQYRWDGSQFVALGGGGGGAVDMQGWVEVATTGPMSNVTNPSFTLDFTTYRRFRLVSNLITSAGQYWPVFRFSTDGGATFPYPVYKYSFHRQIYNSNGSELVGNETSTHGFSPGVPINGDWGFELEFLDIYAPYLDNGTWISGMYMRFGTNHFARYEHGFAVGEYFDTLPINGLQIAGATFASGEFKLFGIPV